MAASIVFAAYKDGTQLSAKPNNGVNRGGPLLQGLNISPKKNDHVFGARPRLRIAGLRLVAATNEELLESLCDCFHPHADTVS